MPARSYLFVPGDRPERFSKALAVGAHAVILDLEDAVTPQRKVMAREAIAAWLPSAPAPVFIRINPDATAWHQEDCALLAAPNLAGVMIPKAEDAQGVAAIAQHLRAGQAMVPLIETAAGHFEARNIASVPGVTRLAFGSFDFMADTGIQADGEELDSVRSHLVLVSRLANLESPVEGVSLAVDDPEQLERDVRRSRRFGMGAKLCIHPRQVAAVNAGFAPSAAEVAWAKRVLDALQSGPLGAIAVDGKLVDKPVAARAAAILREAQA